MAKTVGERLWSRVAQTDNGCWEWLGMVRENGYGSFATRRPDGKWTYTTTHRAAYVDQVGPIPDGWEVDHLCRNRGCVRPDHLEAVTLQENRRRRDVQYSPVVDRSPRPLPALPPPPPPAPKSTPWICRNGHDKRVVGSVVNGSGMITCAACRDEQNARRRKGGAHGTETHCPKGHPYVEGNMYLRRRPDGTVKGRECKTCVDARNRAAALRRKTAKR